MDSAVPRFLEARQLQHFTARSWATRRGKPNDLNRETFCKQVDSVDRSLIVQSEKAFEKTLRVFAFVMFFRFGRRLILDLLAV